MNPLADPVPLFGPEMMADPYPLYHRLRSIDPVYWSETHRAWIVTSYDAVSAGLVDLRLSSDRARLFQELAVTPPILGVEVAALIRRTMPDDRCRKATLVVTPPPRQYEQPVPHCRSAGDTSRKHRGQRSEQGGEQPRPKAG
jgi:cytochrome P450